MNSAENSERSTERTKIVPKEKALLTKFDVKYESKLTPIISREYDIYGTALLQIKIIAYVNNYNYYTFIFVKFVKIRQDNDLKYAIQLTSPQLKIKNKKILDDDGTWRLIYERINGDDPVNFFIISVCVDTTETAPFFAILRDDTELIDFELCGVDGSVHVHKAILAASSPVLRTMLNGTWRENMENRTEIEGASQSTLQHLKDYMYLRTLPDSSLEPLLLLASRYMMSELEQKCIDKLMSNLTAQNTCDLLEFAAQNKMSKLVVAILKCVQRGVVKVNDIEDYVSNSMVAVDSKEHVEDS